MAIAGPMRAQDAMAQNQNDSGPTAELPAASSTASSAPGAPGVVASVEARWDGVYCDLLSVSNAIPGELTIRYRYRNLSAEDFTFPTLKDYVRETIVFEPLAPAVYGPLTDSGGKIVGSTTLTSNGAGKTLASGEAQAHWVKLPAPADDVSAITPIAQGCAPFEDAAIGDGAASVAPLTAPAPAVVAQEMETAGMIVEVVDVRRATGGLLNVMFRYRNNGSQPFSFPVLENKVTDTYIVDSANRTKYEVLHYQSSSPLSSTTQDLRTGSGATIEPGSILNMWAKFPAPPEETTQIGLYVPDAPPFEGLEISGQGAGAAAGGSAIAGTVTALDQALKDLGAEDSETEVRIEMAADVLFDFDEAALKPEGEESLSPVATVLASYPEAQVNIEGHTDSKGDEAYNQTLSEKRAESVKGWLVANTNFDAARIRISGLGETRPIAHNTRPDGSDDPEGRQKNRRVAIVVQK
jgi:outer membrane protein OmpA-like peptidoglycan-associated protein